MEWQVKNASNKENVEILARAVINKVLQDAVRDAEYSAKPKVYINLSATTDDTNDASAWWKTLGHVLCRSSHLLESDSMRALIRERLVQLWCKAPIDSRIELTTSFCK